jgi:hypothetical protein
MLIWGGNLASGATDSGGRYHPDPLLDTWRPFSSTGAASPRSGHSAVWTGSEMIVWGGISGSSSLDTGGLFAAFFSPDADYDGVTVCQGDCDDGNFYVHPGAPEICNGKDENCDGVVDEGGGALCPDSNVCTADTCGGTAGCLHPAVADGTPCDDSNSCTEADACQSGICVGGPPLDADGDGHVDPVCGGDDCDDADSGVWSPPLEVEGVNPGTAIPTTISWNDQGGLVGPETLYDLVSGDFTTAVGISFDSRVCLQVAGASVSHDDLRADPGAGTGYWYLSRATNSCGTGTFGAASNGTQRVVPACP